MLGRISICGVIVALAVPLSAQQMIAPDPNQAAIKFQVKSFESTLKLAVERGGADVAAHARQIVPGVEMSWLSDIDVIGWWRPEEGYTFDVVLPDVGATVVRLIRNIQQQAPAPQPAVRPVSGNTNSNSTASAASADANPDPLVKSPVVPFDPVQELSDKVRQALIDALVDSSAALQFSPGQRLMISAGNGRQLMPDPFGPDSRKLILTVKSDDLLRFRKGELKRDELIALIKESRF